mgnify:FL=1
MQQGDLVHIPQDVKLFDRENIYIGTTQRPIVGVLIKEISDRAAFQAGQCMVFAQGSEAVVERRHAYPLERQC